MQNTQALINRMQISEYYPKQFANDLMQYCFDRFEKDQVSDRLPPHWRRIRLTNERGWLPPKERKDSFFIALYFIVLTDMTLHAHFPMQHFDFDQKTNFPKIYFGFNGRMGPPNLVLSGLENDKGQVLNIWKSYSDYFIQKEWLIELPKICGVDRQSFMQAVLRDKEFNTYSNRSITGKLEGLLADCMLKTMSL